MRATHLTASILSLVNIIFAWPYVPEGGLGTNSTPPYYHPLSDFDFQSIVSLLTSCLAPIMNTKKFMLATLESRTEPRIH